MPIENSTILVTAVSGDLGQAIVKCLRLMDEPVRIIGCDMTPDLGAAFVDRAVAVPAASDAEYLEYICALCRKEKIDAILPASEAEIAVLSLAGGESKLPPETAVVCQGPEWLERFGDKLRCCRELAGKVQLAPFADATDGKEVAALLNQNRFPFIVKSRQGSGSRTIRLVRNREELDEAIRKTPAPMIQHFIGDDYGEFSVGVFACEQFVSAVAFKRELGPVGNSWYADNHHQDPEVIDYCLEIAKVTGLEGSCNVQVRKDHQGVRLLEINPRFSSLVAARAICGFRDLEWSLRVALGEVPAKPLSAFKKVRFRRFFGEVIDFGNGYAAPVPWQPRKHKD